MIKSIKDLLSELRVQNINLVLNEESNLEIVSYKGKISSDLIQEIKEQKQDIIDYLKSYQEESNTKIQLVEKSDSYVVSSAQRSLWLVSQSESASIAYNMPSSTRLEGVYDVSFLQEAIESLIDRHEILRTIFKQDETGEIKQIVLDRSESAFKIDFQDFRNKKDKEKEITNFIEADSIKPFNLEKGSLLRVSLLQISESSYVLYYNMHHIIGDGWSMDVLEKEVLSLYQAYESKSASDLPELRIQYKDYAAWEHNQFENGKMQGHKEFWLDNLSGELPVLNLPSQLIRPKFKTYAGRALRTYISPLEIQRLKNIVQSEEGTLFMGVVGVLKTLLNKYTSESDLVIGFPIINRSEFDLKNQIGFYIKTVAIRSQINVEESFITFFQKIKQNILLAFKHQDYPFDKLVGDLNKIRDVSRSPIFDISVTFHNGSSEASNLADAECSQIQVLGDVSCKNDLEFHFQEVGDFLSFSINYNQDVYDVEIIKKFMLNYKQILSEILSNPNEKIKNINYLSEKEKSKLLLDFNNTEIKYPEGKTIIDLFEEQVEKTPDSIALVFEDKVLTYKELDYVSTQLSFSLRKDYNIEKGDIIGVQLNRSEWSVISILGIMKSGGVYLPIDSELPSKRKTFMVEESDLKLLITETSFLLELDFYEGNLFSIDVEFDSSVEFDCQNLELKSNDLAYIIFTSGSTGNPKGVMVEHSGILNTILSQIDLFNLHESKKSLQFASFSFDASISEIFITLLSGSSLYVLNENVRKDIKMFEKYIFENKIEIATLPPAYLKLLNVSNLQSLKVLITAGESAPFDKVLEYSKFGTYYNAYGPTETSICATVFKVEKGTNLNSSSIPIGSPISNTSIYIVDQFNNLLSEGVVGEVWIGGSGLSRGYLNQPELTAEKFIANPFVEGEIVYKTGDLGRWLPDGNIEYQGRIDDQVKIRGHRIELGEIEQLISNQHFITQSVVVVKERDNEKYIVAYCISEHEIDKKSLQNNLRKILPEYMLPSYYIQLDAIPLTSNGKIDWKNLPNLKDEDLIKEEFIAPRTEEEELLVSILIGILKHNQISVKDNLYNMGVHSITTIQLVTQLKQLGYRISVEELLKYPVIEDLAEFIRSKSDLKKEIFLNEQDFESSIISEESNYFNEFEYGASMELSPNQIRFFKLTHLTNVLDFEIPDYNEKEFDRKFRLFLHQFPMLTLEYENKKNKIFQRYISAKEMKYKLLTEDASLKSPEEIKKIGNSFIYATWNLLEEELIRVFIVKDNINKVKVFIGIPYSFLDLYSRNIILSEIINFFHGNEKEKNYYHPFTFINYQKEFLASKEGIEQRNFWVEALIKTPMINNSINIMDNVSKPSIVQEAFISGDNFEKIKNLSVKHNLPVNAIFNSFYEMILSDLNNTDKKLYGVLVNGREADLQKLDTSKIVGVINNMIPFTYENHNGFNIEGVIKCYSKYLEARENQKIPYETICEDLFKFSGKELNKNIIGYFNFHEFENFKSIDSEDITQTIMDNNASTYDTCLVCILHPNGIILRFVCLDEVYEKNKKILSLSSNINKLLEIVKLL